MSDDDLWNLILDNNATPLGHGVRQRSWPGQCGHWFAAVKRQFAYRCMEIHRPWRRYAGVTNHISEPSDEQYIQDAPDKAVFNYLNDTEFQTIPSTAKAWLP